MAVSYQIPSWLQGPTDTAGAFEQGTRLGLEAASLRQQADEHNQAAALEQQKLAQSAAQARMESQVRQQQIQQESEIAKQKLQVQQQYQQQQVALRADAVKEQTMKVNMAAKEAAEKYAAHTAYQNLYQQGIDAGLDPSEASSKALLSVGPALTGTGAAMPAAIKRLTPESAAPAPTAQAVQLPEGGEQTVITMPGSKQMLMPKNSGMTDYQRANLKDKAITRLDKAEAAIEKNWDGEVPSAPDKKWNSARLSQWTADVTAMSKIKAARAKLQGEEEKPAASTDETTVGRFKVRTVK